MSYKTLLLLLAAALIALASAFLMQHSRRPLIGVSASENAMLPGLQDALNEIDQIRLIGANDQALVSLQRGERNWVVLQRGQYPAAIGKVRDFLLQLADARLIEEKTASPERYSTLGVSDIADPRATGVLVELSGGPSTAAVILGNFNPQGGGTFVRRVDDAQSWLAKGTLVTERNPAEWLDKDIVDIASSQIIEVELTDVAGKHLRVFKDEPGQENFQVADVPKGRQLSSDYAANGLASVLAELRLEDVVANSDMPVPDDAIHARYRRLDGLLVDVRGWKSGERHYATLVASIDPAVIVLADAGAEAGATDVSDDGNAAAGEAAADVTEDLGASHPLSEEVARLNARWSGWSYVLPPFKFANIDKSMADLLLAKPAAGK